MSRLLVRVALGMIALLLGTAVIFRLTLTSSARRVTEERLSQVLTVIEEGRQRLESTPRQNHAREIAALRKRTIQPLRVAARGKLPADVRQRLADNQPIVVLKSGAHHIYVPLRQGEQVLVVGPLERLWPHTTTRTVLIVGGTLTLMLVIGVLLVWPIVRRLRRLERAAERISAGDLGARAEARGKDAVSSLARRFNAMADRVQALLESQQQLLQAVSHELRTPISRLRFGIEMLADDQEATQRATRMAALEEDLDELEQCVDELLVYIKLGDRALALHREPVEPQELLRELAARHQELHPHLRFHTNGQPPEDPAPRCEADPKHLRRALENLFSNAARYAREAVSAHVEQNGTGIAIVVDDDGPGIPDAERDRIFEPFTRLDDSRCRESGGVGLGLSIVRRIVDAHGGAVHAETSPGGGARFVTQWPRAQTPAARVHSDT